MDRRLLLAALLATPLALPACGMGPAVRVVPETADRLEEQSRGFRDRPAPAPLERDRRWPPGSGLD